MKGVFFDFVKKKGFDSLLYYNADDQKNKQSNDARSKSFTYKIFDSTNVLPMYKAEFNNQTNSSSSTKRLCEECDQKDAEVYCINCEVYLCKDDDDLIHGDSSNDKTLKQIFDHKREKVDKMKAGKCYFDLDKDVEFFCRTCNLPICAYCKVIGSHSKGNALDHVLEDIVNVHKMNDPQSNEVLINCDNRRKKSVECLLKIKTLTE